MTEVLPGVTLDPKDETELEAQFGVTSNAEELVRQNRARYTPAQLAAQKRPVNPTLTEHLYEGGAKLKLDDNGQLVHEHDSARQFKPDLAEALGHEVVDAVVRGSGQNAVISYVYTGPRGAYEKDILPFHEVFGSASERKAARKDRTESPEGILQDAEERAAEELRDARDEASKVLQAARDEAAKLVAEAEAEINKLRGDAAEKAAQTAEKQQEESSGDASAKQRAARSGSSGSSGKRGGPSGK